MNTATVKVVNSNDRSGGFMIINKDDYDADQKKPEGERQYSLHDDNGKVDDQPGNVAGNDGRNASGTFSEPTPTDIRYPNKMTTEFENNGAALKGQSASELRQAAGLEDKAGGLAPEVHEKVKEAEAALADAGTSADPKIVREISVENAAEKKSGKSK